MIEAEQLTKFGFSKNRSQMLIITAVRILFQVAVLFIAIAFQSLQADFVNFDVLFPVFVVLTSTFIIDILVLLFFEKVISSKTAVSLVFAFDTFYITLLIFFSGINQSIFLFLYLVNIILCGFVFQRKGALILALWTSMLFSLLLIFGPEVRGQTLYFAVGVNNLAFFAVAGLAGYLSEQLNFMGSELQARGKDLRALKNFNQLVIQNMATGMITVDSEGEMLQVNSAGEEILEINESDYLGRSVDLLLDGFVDWIKEQNFIDTGKRRVERDFNYEAGFGEKKLIGLTVSPLRDEESRLTGYILTFQDLTKIRRLESAMRQSEKLAAVGQLAAGIAHEIRNPLASISGSIQMMEGLLEANEMSDEKKLMRITLKEIDRLNNMITEFLDFVRPDKTQLKKMDLNLLVRNILEMVKVDSKLRADIDFQVKLDGSAFIEGDQDKLKQALLNIIINACQAMDSSEKPVLIVESQDFDQKILLKVKDSGCGMDERTLKRIFEPFLTTKPKGTGLGLAVTHKILESHQAKIFVDSAVGVGTEFILEFPKFEESSAESGEGAGETSKDSKLLAEFSPSKDDRGLKVKGT